jgi:deoxyribodipyrimidine photo-lyase
VIDQSYEALDRLARQPMRRGRTENDAFAQITMIEPPLLAQPPSDLGWTRPEAAAVAGREVWLVHPWNLGELPSSLPANTVVIGVFVTDFHRAWPWSERRWRFVASRMAELTALRWQGDVATLGAALQGAAQVRSVDEPHLAPWLARLAVCEAAVELFPAVDRRCDSFSQWWTRASRGLASASELLVARQAPAW